MPQTVPAEARAVWGDAVGRVCEDLADAAANAHGPQSGEELLDKLEDLHSLPARGLADPRSKGRPARTLRRLDLISRGEPLDQPEGVGRRATVRQRRLTEDQLRAARAEQQLSRGSVTRAARAMDGAPLANARDAAVRQQLLDKHPQRALPDPLDADEPALQVTMAQFNIALERIARKRGTAGGPSGWTYEHLHAAVSASARARAGVFAVVNLLLSGRMPRCPTLLDSSLIGLTKPDGGVRPIAIGEVWYRFAGLCALVALEGVGRGLAPMQLCVGVSGGAEAAGLAVKAALAADPQAMLLTLDIENCFNSLDRGAMFAAVKRRAPSLLPFVQWAYGAPTALHVVGAPDGAAPVPSTVGVKQGDPLGMLLAALVLHEVQEQVARGAQGTQQVGFADDLNAVGSAGQLRSTMQCLNGARGLRAAGLRLQLRKCALTGGDAAVAAALAQELGVSHRPDGVVVAGTPIGTPAFVAATVAERAEAVVAQVDAVTSNKHLRVQTKWLLLRMSHTQRMPHFSRIVPWAQLGASVRRVEQVLLSAAVDLFKLPHAIGPGATATQSEVLAQLCLPERVGGFGLRTTSETAAGAALVACAARAQAALAEAPEALQPLRGASRVPILATWQAVHKEVDDACGWGAAARGLPPEFERDRAPRVQNEVARVLADREAAFSLTMTAVAADSVEKKRAAARLRSAAGGPASALWTTMPTAPATRVGDDDFVMAGRHRLGFGPGAATGPCTCGRDATLPDHAQACALTDDVFRHDSVASTVRGIVRTAGCATSAEPRYNYFAGARAGEKRGDATVVLGTNKLAILDVVVTHPANRSYWDGAARESGYAARLAEQGKIRRLGNIAAGAGFTFVPFAVESFGRLGSAAMGFLSEIGDIAASTGKVTKRAFLRGALSKLACALARGNGRMYTTGVFAMTRACGRNYMPGLPVPVADVVPE